MIPTLCYNLTGRKVTWATLCSLLRDAPIRSSSLLAPPWVVHTLTPMTLFIHVLIKLLMRFPDWNTTTSDK